MFCQNCGAKRTDKGGVCPQCGSKALTAATAEVGIHGKELVLPRSATEAPKFCVRCGSSKVTPVAVTFSWHNPLLYILALSPLIYIIVALIVRKTMKLKVFLCAEHRSKRKRAQVIAASLLLGCIPLGLLVGNLVDGDGFGPGFLVGLVAFVAGIVVLGIGSSTLSPVKIDEFTGRFKGFSDAFGRKTKAALERAAAAAAATTGPA